MRDTSSFGQWLKQRRKSLGLTQKDLAQQAGCATVTLRKIEAGGLRPSAQLAACLARCLGVAEADVARVLEFALSESDQHGFAPHGGRLFHPDNLPAQLTPLIGREPDIATVRDRLFDGVRLITLTGSPGVGKTRLALAVAEDAQGRFEHGVIFVRLAPVSHPDMVTPAIVQALGLRVSGLNPPVVQVRAHLEEKHLLLVLDNFEHVVEAAPLVDDMLRRCPWLHVLATSRQALRIRGERQVPVRPLALPVLKPGAPRLTAGEALNYPAVAMFAERAQAVRPDFAVTDHNAPTVADICRRLDGLPLAIELVASRVALLPPDELFAHLSGPWMLSLDGLRAVPDRQKTLRGAIGWSYDLLSPADQALFTRLAVFEGGCTLAAAETVCGDLYSSSAQVLDGIASLLDKSLLHGEFSERGQCHYTMLDTVREFARERLAQSSKANEARNSHLAWCLTVVEPALATPFAIVEQPSWQQIDDEIHNLSAALEWSMQRDRPAAVKLALATGRTLASRGFIREARTAVEKTLALAEVAGSSVERAALLYCQGVVEFLTDQTAAAERSMAAVLALCGGLGVPAGEAAARYYLGRLAVMAGHAARAESHLEDAAAALLAAGEMSDWGHVISVLAEVVMFRGDLARSRALHAQALAHSRPAELRHQQFSSVGGLAELAMLEGDYEEAQRLAEECLDLCRQRNRPAETAWPLTCLGEIATRRGDYAAAHEALDEALRLGRYTDSYWRVIIVRADLGDLALAEGKPGQALRYYRETLPVLLRRGIFTHPKGTLRLARLAGAVGQHEVASTLLSACLASVENGLRVFLPITRADFDQALAKGRAALDADAFATAWTAGQALGPQAAVTWGLQAIRVSGQRMPV